MSLTYDTPRQNMAMARVAQRAARKGPALMPAASFHCTAKREGVISTVGGLGIMGCEFHHSMTLSSVTPKC